MESKDDNEEEVEEIRDIHKGTKAFIEQMNQDEEDLFNENDVD